MHWANDPFKFFKCCLPQILKTRPFLDALSHLCSCKLDLNVNSYHTLCKCCNGIKAWSSSTNDSNLHAVFLIHVSFLGFYFHFAWNVWKSFLFPQLSQESLKLVPNKIFCFQIFKISNQKVAILIKMIHSRYVG